MEDFWRGGLLAEMRGISGLNGSEFSSWVGVNTFVLLTRAAESRTSKRPVLAHDG